MIALFTVEDRFQIGDQCSVLVPGLSTEPGSPVVRIGAGIQRRTPDGKIINTHVRGIEMMHYIRNPEKITAPILPPPHLHKDDVPLGAEVFLVHTPGAEIEADA